MSPASMSRTAERERALAALAGAHFPKVGDVGLYLGRIGGPRRRVRVARVSGTGKTVWFSSGDHLVGHGVAWRRWPQQPDWWAPVPRSAFPHNPRVQLPAPKP